MTDYAYAKNPVAFGLFFPTTLRGVAGEFLKNGVPLRSRSVDTSSLMKILHLGTAERAKSTCCWAFETHERMSDPHDDLGVRPGASDEEIKAAFRRLAHVHHPDKQSSPELSAAAKFQFNKITAARNRLLGNHGGCSVVGGGSASQWASAGASAGIRNANRVSNLGFAVVLTFPLCLIGVVSQWAFPNDTSFVAGPNERQYVDRRTHRRSGDGNEFVSETDDAGVQAHMGRIHGVLEPPVNPWLRDDVVHAGRRKGHARPAMTDRISRRLMALVGIRPASARRGASEGGGDVE